VIQDHAILKVAFFGHLGETGVPAVRLAMLGRKLVPDLVPGNQIVPAVPDPELKIANWNYVHFGQRGVHGLTVISTAALVLKQVFEVVPILPKKIEPVTKTVLVLQANRKTASSKNVLQSTAKKRQCVLNLTNSILREIRYQTIMN